MPNPSPDPSGLLLALVVAECKLALSIGTPSRKFLVVHPSRTKAAGSPVEHSIRACWPGPATLNSEESRKPGRLVRCLGAQPGRKSLPRVAASHDIGVARKCARSHPHACTVFFLFCLLRTRDTSWPMRSLVGRSTWAGVGSAASILLSPSLCCMLTRNRSALRGLPSRPYQKGVTISVAHGGFVYYLTSPRLWGFCL